ncbi:hypothetical protein [Nostoc sp. C110]|uniref:hypothetical protein n=1 Tax=Nostoc sp. C110 TaxID=3349876 RepID=UPI00370DC4FB
MIPAITTAELIESLKLIIPVLAAVGGLTTAIIGLWRFIGPKLYLKMVNPEGEVKLGKPILGELTRFGNSLDAPLAYLYHLEVINKNRWMPANNVRILLTRISRTATDDTFLHENLPGSIQLKWSAKRNEVESCSSQIIGAGSNAVVNLGFLIQTHNDFELDICVVTPNFQGKIQANQKMDLEVVAQAEHTRSNTVCIQIFWDGQWNNYPDLMKKHLQVTVVKCKRREKQ